MLLFCLFLAISFTICSTFRHHFRYPLSGLRRTMHLEVMGRIADRAEVPLRRDFVPLSSPPSSAAVKVVDELRVLQFNLLADGLSGLREDLGAFSRAQAKHMTWQDRQHKLLYEIVQYNPDVITLQECDHYYDFFNPELLQHGYDGVFAAKPVSTCLEVSDKPDGCAVFYKRDKLRLTSTESMTYALSKTEKQNQVALLLVFQLQRITADGDAAAPAVVVATTHLKAAKTAVGERHRLDEAQQLLRALERTSAMLADQCALIVTGDFNTCPVTNGSLGFECTAIPAFQAHPLGMRSVLNDDLRAEGDEDKTWTTWKARKKGNQESIVKHCIDYIFYAPLLLANKVGVRAKAVLRGFTDDEVDEALLPNSRYPSDHIAIAADLQIVTTS